MLSTLITWHYLKFSQLIKVNSFTDFFFFDTIAISRRKLEYSVEVVTKAVNSQDLKTLNIDNVELLQRMVPNDTEVMSLYCYLLYDHAFYVMCSSAHHPCCD